MNMKYENFIYSTLEFAHFCPKKRYEIGRRYAQAESTKQMEQTLRAKVKIFFKSENLKKCF